MLKIRDDVDLKELEKFGYGSYYSGFERGFNGCYVKWISAKCSVVINNKNRQIYKFMSSTNNEYYERFFKEVILQSKDIGDITQAGLVEKVEE